METSAERVQRVMALVESTKELEVEVQDERDPKKLAEHATHRIEAVREAVGRNRSTDPATLRMLASDWNGHVRQSVACNPSAPPELLAELARDGGYWIHYWLKRNPSTPQSTLWEIERQEEHRHRAWGEKSILDLAARWHEVGSWKRAKSFERIRAGRIPSGALWAMAEEGIAADIKWLAEQSAEVIPGCLEDRPPVPDYVFEDYLDALRAVDDLDQERVNSLGSLVNRLNLPDRRDFFREAFELEGDELRSWIRNAATRASIKHIWPVKVRAHGPSPDPSI